jgi:ATP-dependent DNA helicase RecG
MTATPIPRSLQLTLFGDLDISIINELPKNRQPIITKIWTKSTRDELHAKVKEELATGRQVYWITPLVEKSEATEEMKPLKNATDWAKKLEHVFKPWRVGLLHGKMPAAEKDAVMEKFQNHELDILVSTTVIEVGVDVPNATTILVENAERFGLAQLHQLRGRVGRDEHQSYCYLLPTDIESIPRRLRYLSESTDGFWLAEKDLELRGAGEIYGVAQHGELDLQIANLADTKLIKQAAKAADWFTQTQKLANYSTLRQKIHLTQKITTLN